MLPKSVRKIVDFIKTGCEEWGGELQIAHDEASFYRHVAEMLDAGREPPELAPAEIVEEHFKISSSIDPLSTPTEIRTAAHWAWVLFHDLFGEYPLSGDEDSYMGLIYRVLVVRPHILRWLLGSSL